MVSYYIKDLVTRQNKSLTEAQKDSIMNTRRYSMNEINDATKKLSDKTYQIDLDNNPMYSFINPKKKLDEKEIPKVEKTIEITEAIIVSKLINLDVESNLKFTIVDGFLRELVDSLEKLHNHIENKAQILRFTVDGKYVTICPDEIKTTIEFLDKLDRLPNDSK